MIAGRVHDAGIALEVCITSNSCLGTPVESHPVRLYRDAGFRLSVNPDDRAITTTTVENEYRLWRDVAHEAVDRLEAQSWLRGLGPGVANPEGSDEPAF